MSGSQYGRPSFAPMKPELHNSTKSAGIPKAAAGEDEAAGTEDAVMGRIVARFRHGVACVSPTVPCPVGPAPALHMDQPVSNEVITN